MPGQDLVNLVTRAIPHTINLNESIYLKEKLGENNSKYCKVTQDRLG
jgi:hypothetical protein